MLITSALLIESPKLSALMSHPEITVSLGLTKGKMSFKGR